MTQPAKHKVCTSREADWVLNSQSAIVSARWTRDLSRGCTFLVLISEYFIRVECDFGVNPSFESNDCWSFTQPKQSICTSHLLRIECSIRAQCFLHSSWVLATMLVLPVLMGLDISRMFSRSFFKSTGLKIPILFTFDTYKCKIKKLLKKWTDSLSFHEFPLKNIPTRLADFPVFIMYAYCWNGRVRQNLNFLKFPAPNGFVQNWSEIDPKTLYIDANPQSFRKLNWAKSFH